MEWEILVVGGGTLIGFVALIVKPLINLNTTLITLNNSIENLGDDIACLRKDNKDDHEEINDKLENHEGRIRNVEIKTLGGE